MSKNEFPFTIFAVAEEGINVPVAGRTDELAQTAYTLYPGYSAEITEGIYAATLDSTGASWLDQSEDQQRARYGKVLFGRGEVSAEAKAVADAARAKIVAAEMANLRQSNPGLAKRSGAAARLTALEAELLELSGIGD